MSRQTSVLVLQVLAGLLIALGICGLIGSVLAARASGAAVAVVVIAIGLRYWFRAVRLKEKVLSGNGL